MYRLLTLVFSMFFFATLQPAAASSNNVLELVAPKKASLQVIGKKPPKRHIELELGNLRTGPASLPEGERDLKARIRLLNRRKLERLKAGPKPQPKKKKKKAKTEDQDVEREAADNGEEEIKPQKARDDERREVAERKEPKITKSYQKKKNRKKSGGGLPELPPSNAGSGGAVIQ